MLETVASIVNVRAVKYRATQAAAASAARIERRDLIGEATGAR
jgi:hypothetical protein